MEVIHNYGGNTQRINKLQHNLSIVALNQSNIKTSNVNNKIVKSN